MFLQTYHYWVEFAQNDTCSCRFCRVPCSLWSGTIALQFCDDWLDCMNLIAQSTSILLNLVTNCKLDIHKHPHVPISPKVYRERCPPAPDGFVDSSLKTEWYLKEAKTVKVFVYKQATTVDAQAEEILLIWMLDIGCIGQSKFMFLGWFECLKQTSLWHYTHFCCGLAIVDADSVTWLGLVAKKACSTVATSRFIPP